MEHRWGFLAPWWEVLRPRIHFSEEDWDFTPDQYVWQLPEIVLKVTMPRRQRSGQDEAAFRKLFQKVREALALLAAVAHADYAAYDHILTEHCGIKRGKYGEEHNEKNIAVKFVVDLDEDGHETHYDGADAVEYDLVRFCGTHQRVHPSEEYLTALKQIAALDENLALAKTGVDIKIPVKMSFCGKATGPTPGGGRRNYAKALRDVAIAEKEIATQWEAHGCSTGEMDLGAGELRCTFVVEPMLAEADVMLLNREAAEVLDYVISGNVWFSCLDLYMDARRENFLSALEARKTLGQLLRRIFDNTQRRQADAHIDYYFETADATTCNRELIPKSGGCSQIAVLKLAIEPRMPASDFEAMCSTMVLTQTTKKLSVDFVMDTLDGPTRERRWQWLAYGLFSKRCRACSSIETLIISGIEQWSTMEIRAFTSILTSEHPEETLFGTPRGRLDERDATLRRDAPMRWELDREGQPVLDSPHITLGYEIPFVRTFSDDGESEWVDVLVPGFGRCQAQRANLDFQRVPTPNSSSRGITSLTIAFDSEMADLEGLIPFIASIGASLEKLVLDGPQSVEPRFMDENTIIRSCPILRELTFARQLTEVQLDFSEYRATNTPIPEFKFTWDDVVEFSKQLRDPTAPLTKCVRCLRFSLVPDNDPPNENAPSFEIGMSAVLRMLEVNERLEYLEVEVESPFHELVRDLKKFHLKPIHRQREPLPRKCMLAFLSVLASRTPSAETVKKKKVDAPQVFFAEIDSHVVAKIFSFAAVPVVREVFLRYSEQQAPQAWPWWMLQGHDDQADPF